MYGAGSGDEPEGHGFHFGELTTMSNPFFDHPILNSPYERPGKHWELAEDGQPTQRLIEKRRDASYITPIPKPKKRKAGVQERLFDEGRGISSAEQEYDPTPIINALRQQIDTWRAIPNPADWGVTPETARLLQHWRQHKFSSVRPFFCQVEAVETAIWLTEVAPQIGKAGKGFLGHLENANRDANPELMRLALKLATGAGKTTVMAMLIAWQTINSVRRPTSTKFTRGFLVVAPGLTIKDRLRVLRALRFAAQLDFAIDAATWMALCATNLDGLSGERLMQEWDKAMACRHPDRWLSLLSSSGRLKEWCPPLQGIALAQTLVRLQRQASTLAVRCAICLAEAPIDPALAWLKNQPLPSERIQIITWLLTTDIEQIQGAPASARWRALRRGWPTELVEYQSCRAPEHPVLPTLKAWAADSRSSRTWKPMLRAADLLGMGFTPGPALGKALADVEDQELAGELVNRDQALAYAAGLRHPTL